MNTEQLKTFCSVARTLSFTASAQELMISQPAISRQIARMEDEIGARLFVREHNALFLTEAGRQLSEELPGRMEELESLFFSAHLLDIGKIRRLKLGVLRNQVIHPEVVRVLREMRDEQYYVTMQEYDFDTIEQALFNHDVDAVISLRWVGEAFRGCSSKILAREAMCIAVNEEYSPRFPQPVSIDELEEFSRKRPVMVPKISSYPGSQYSAMGGKISQLWNGVLEEHIDAVVPMVKLGIGAALVNETHILSQEKNVVFFPLDFLDRIPLEIFWLKGRNRDSVGDFVGRLSS